MKYMNLSILELHNLIINNEVSPLELVKEALSLAKQDSNNAFEYICEKEAIELVNKLDSKNKDSLLYGIPVVIKDNLFTKDIPTTASSNMLSNHVPTYSSEVVNRLEKAGAIIIGKSTMDELAMGGKGTSGHLGATYNPWDKSHARIIGGSSSGSAAVVSSSIVPFSIGSDTGDSIRKPASYAGLVGLKPTWGRISRYGLLPFACSLDHVGFFTRNVKDSAIVLSVLAGHDDKDETSSLEPVDDYIREIDNPVKGNKIAVVRQVFDLIKNENMLSFFNKTIASLIASGASVEYIDIDNKILRAIYPTYTIISGVESTQNCANLDGVHLGVESNGNTEQEIIMNSRTNGFGYLVKRKFVIGGYSLEDKQLYEKAKACRKVIVEAFNKIFEKYDAIYCPVAEGAAPLATKQYDELSDEFLIAENYLAFANFGGYPSITVPIGFDEDMPIGANLTCKPFEEAKLLCIADKIEQSTGLANISAIKNKD